MPYIVVILVVFANCGEGVKESSSWSHGLFHTRHLPRRCDPSLTLNTSCDVGGSQRPGQSKPCCAGPCSGLNPQAPCRVQCWARAAGSTCTLQVCALLSRFLSYRMGQCGNSSVLSSRFIMHHPGNSAPFLDLLNLDMTGVVLGFGDFWWGPAIHRVV